MGDPLKPPPLDPLSKTNSKPVTRHASRWRLIRLTEVDSTQDVAREQGEAGVVVVAERQRRGRGRRGTMWCSPPGGLWLSAVFPPPAPAHVQVAGAVARALGEGLDLPIVVDPPNDLQLCGKKLGGVLIETSTQGDEEGLVILGIGINVNNPLPEELADTAVSLREALGRPIDLEKILEIVLSVLDDFRGVGKCRE